MEGNAIEQSEQLRNRWDQETDDIDLMNTFHGATSRGSVKLVHSVIASFNGLKKQIVRGIGYGGMLYFPQLKQLNLKFSRWLLSRVDDTSSSIIIDERRVYKFKASDINIVFGLPATGRDVRDQSLDRSESAIEKIRGRLGIQGKESRSLKAAQAILLKYYGNNMNQDEIDAFKTAFIVFMMGNFFAPTSKYNYCSLDYWPALTDPSLITKFNWGKYIVEEICDAAKKLKCA